MHYTRCGYLYFLFIISAIEQVQTDLSLILNRSQFSNLLLDRC
jgi:hypothetical protein